MGWRVSGAGWEKNKKKVVEYYSVRKLSMGYISKLGRWLALYVTRSGSVGWHSLKRISFGCFYLFIFFIFLLKQCHTDEAAYINPVYSLLFLLNEGFLLAVTGERIDCALPLILWLSCHFEVRDQNRDGTQR